MEMEIGNSYLKKKNAFIQHVDFDRGTQIFYNNIYFKENKMILKMPLVSMREREIQNEIKIEKFDVTKYVYLMHYD